MRIEDRLNRLEAFHPVFKHLRRTVRLRRRHTRATTGGYPDLRGLLSATDASVLEAAATGGGPEILVATSTGGHLGMASMEGILAAALKLRGARVHVLLCDELLPGCMECDYTWYPDRTRFTKRGPQGDMCRDCFAPALAMYEPLGVEVHRYSQLVSSEERAEATRLAAETPATDIPGFVLDGLALGEHALAGALRFFARGDLAEEPLGEPVLRRYFEAALLTAYATRRLFATTGIQAAVFHHGIYVPQGIIGEVARAEGVRVVNWNPAYRKNCFIFSHEDTYHHTLMTEPTELWEDIEWTPQLERLTMEYLESRWQGTEDWIWFHERPETAIDKIVAEIGIDPKKPAVGLLTNVIWDAQLHYPANAFGSMVEWLLRTVEWFERHPELQLIIRIHPAELRGTLRTQQPATKEIAHAFPDMPPNVFVIGPESNVSTYATMLACDSVIIYGTKTGVELTSMGMPVIVAGEAWIRNKGITLDAASAEEYFEILERLPLGYRLEGEALTRARKYAFHFFFRRMIPLPFMEPTGDWPPYRAALDSLEPLLPGRVPGLDVVCDGIMRGTAFVFPAERYEIGE